jgi:hypothetical protein
MFLILRMRVRQIQSREFSENAANDSPSPWGEGRDEGGRKSFLHVMRYFAAISKLVFIRG